MLPGAAQPQSLIPVLSKAQWHDDLRYFAVELPKKHKNAFHRIGRAQFGDAVARLDAGIDTLKDYEIVTGLQRLAAMIGDGHEFLDHHSPERLVIDMRQNGGGNLGLVREHLIPGIRRRPSLNVQGRLFVLIGRKTFSAAMANAADFRRQTNALLVGEPTGARPNGYQELYQFTLPNSKLQVSCSIRYYQFQDEDTPAVMPDQWIEPDWIAYRSGRDPVVERILQGAVGAEG
jgi:hypothetical protein